MYLPKSKYVASVAKPGEYIDGSGKEYVGPIIETYTGETYAGRTPQSAGAKLTALAGKAKIKTVTVIKRVPTEAEYEAGVMTRYFVQDLKTKKIIEILPESYKVYQEATGEHLVNLIWKLKGNLDRVRVHNKMVIDMAELEMPGLQDQILTDPLQFYRP